jgi:hypothetical protein
MALAVQRFGLTVVYEVKREKKGDNELFIKQH